jgi:hypothetical protein
MSIKNKNTKALAELQETLVNNDHIQNVHFAANGDHYFMKHELVKKGKQTDKFYGYLGLQYEPTAKDPKLFKPVHVEIPKTEIVETLSREDVLKFKVKSEKETEKVEKPKVEKPKVEK